MYLLVCSTKDVNTGSPYSNLLPNTMEEIILATALYIGGVVSNPCPAFPANRKKVTFLFLFFFTDTPHIVSYNTKTITVEFLKDFNEAVSFLNDFVLPRLLANPTVSQVSQSQLPHLFP